MTRREKRNDKRQYRGWDWMKIIYLKDKHLERPRVQIPAEAPFNPRLCLTLALSS